MNLDRFRFVVEVDGLEVPIEVQPFGDVVSTIRPARSCNRTWDRDSEVIPLPSTLPAPPTDATCSVCNGPAGWVNCPTGGWWSHRAAILGAHPADDHDAEPVHIGHDATCMRCGKACRCEDDRDP